MLKIPKQVFLQTVKTQMKYRIVRYFIWVYTVKGKILSQKKKYNIFFNVIIGHP